MRHFVQHYARKYQLPRRPVSPQAMTALEAHHWPGNVRELSHAVERALILSDGDELGAADFQLAAGGRHARRDALNLEASERRLVMQALDEAGGNISRAAALLGITRAALYRRIEKFGL